MGNVQLQMIKDVSNFLKSLEKNKLLVNQIEHKFDPQDLTDLSSTARFNLGVEKLLERQDKIIDEGFDKYEFTDLIIEIRAFQFCIRIESIRYFLAQMLNAKRLQTSKEKEKRIPLNLKNETIGRIIWRINEKLYPLRGTTGTQRKSLESMWKKNNDIFFVEFRNSIIHRKFKVTGGVLSYGSPKNRLEATDFHKMNLQLDVLEIKIWKKYYDMDSF